MVLSDEFKLATVYRRTREPIRNKVGATQRERGTDVQHHHQADDLWTGFKIAVWVAFCHGQTLRDHPALL